MSRRAYGQTYGTFVILLYFNLSTPLRPIHLLHAVCLCCVHPRTTCIILQSRPNKAIFGLFGPVSILGRFILPCHVLPCHVLARFVLPYHVLPCRVFFTVPCFTVPCFTVSCFPLPYLARNCVWARVGRSCIKNTHIRDRAVHLSWEEQGSLPSWLTVRQQGVNYTVEHWILSFAAGCTGKYGGCSITIA